MHVLGIETSCDETAVAMVRDDGAILANVILSQIAEHTPFGGVVPEIAARAHMQHLERLTAEALREAGLALADVDAIAATAGPGLIGGVIVGASFGKALALAAGKPFLPINHLEGHALTARLTDGVAFPYLLLLASGGHCQFIAVAGVGNYTLLGETLDDAPGEAFDKVAKLLGLGFPGGPAVERAAKGGNPHAFPLPLPLKGRDGCDFSFSGLKTAVREAAEHLPAHRAADVCAAFQHAVCAHMADRAENALAMFESQWLAEPKLAERRLVIAGGVAANQAIRAALSDVAATHGFSLVAPPARLCTDNAAMIAWAGLERLRLGVTGDLSFAPRARWGLAEVGGA